MVNLRLDKLDEKKYIITMTDEDGNIISNPRNLSIQKGTPEQIYKRIVGRKPKKDELEYI